MAWWRRPASRLGPLMMLTGFVMGLTPMQWSSQPLVHSVGNFFDMLPAALFLHVFLAFPSGRVRDRAERVLVVVMYAVTLGLQLVKILLGSNPDSLFTVVAAPAAGTVVEQVQLALVAVRPGRRDRAVAPAPVGPRAATPTSGDAGRRRVQLRAGDARTALHRRPAGLVLHRADPADHLRRPGAGAARLPLRPARPAARPRRRGGSARGAAVGPDDRPAGPAGARTARPVAAVVLLAARVRDLGRPGRHAHRGTDLVRATGASACCLGRASRWPR